MSGLLDFFSSTLTALQELQLFPNSLQPHGLQPARLLCPCHSPGKNTGVGCHALLQGVFPTQGSNPGLLDCRQILYHLSHQGRRRRGGQRMMVGWPRRLNGYEFAQTSRESAGQGSLESTGLQRVRRDRETEQQQHRGRQEGTRARVVRARGAGRRGDTSGFGSAPNA